MRPEPWSPRRAPLRVRRPFPTWCGFPAATFRMGSNRIYPEERPVHRVAVDGFWMDRPPGDQRAVRTLRRGDRARDVRRDCRPTRADYPGALPEMLVRRLARLRAADREGGSLGDFRQLVAVRAAAPTGATRTVRTARSRARGASRSCTSRSGTPKRSPAWDGKALPTEAEWEFAARGGLDGAAYRVGRRVPARRSPHGQHVARRVPVAAPRRETASSGRRRWARYPPNGYGLDDVIGNVWEWTTDWYVPRHPDEHVKACCIPTNPRGPRLGRQLRPAQPDRDPAQGAEGRVAPVRAELLPAVSAGGALSRAGRHVHLARRVPLHRAPVRVAPRTRPATAHGRLRSDARCRRRPPRPAGRAR